MFGILEFVVLEVIIYECIIFVMDLWFIGVIVYILMSGLLLFMGDIDVEIFMNVQLVEWDFDDFVFDDVFEEVKDFISSFFVFIVSKRGMVDQLLKYYWFIVKKDKGKKLKIDCLKVFIVRRKWK